MDWNEIKKSLQHDYGDAILKWREHNVRRIYVNIAPETLVPLVKVLFEVHQARFIIASAVDTPRGGIEVLYHFDFQGLPQVLSLRVFLSKPELKVASLTSIITGTSWIEREIAELFGVTFVGHPDPKHLLLPNDWPEGQYPLRRDS